jgi:HEAT repeat protein
MANEACIRQLIVSLWHADEQVRRQAIETLAEIGAPAVPMLMVALRKDDHNYDLQVIENPDLREAILRVGEPAFQAVVAMLKPGRRMVRAASKMLQLFDDPRAVDPLISAMRNEHIDLGYRQYAIEALGWFRDRRAFQPLIEALSDWSSYIRHQAARALAEYGDPSVEPLIRKALEGEGSVWRSTGQDLQSVLGVLKRRMVGDDSDRDWNCYKHWLGADWSPGYYPAWVQEFVTEQPPSDPYAEDLLTPI